MIDEPTLAYVAGVVDLLAVIRTRKTPGSELPYVALSGSFTPMLEYMGQLTGTKSFITTRSYSKAGCAEHCKEKHQHIVSTSGRWSVSGAKATILLWNIRPYLRLQLEEATVAISVGLRAAMKPTTVQKMADLGWDIPDLTAPASYAHM